MIRAMLELLLNFEPFTYIIMSVFIAVKFYRLGLEHKKEETLLAIAGVGTYLFVVFVSGALLIKPHHRPSIYPFNSNKDQILEFLPHLIGVSAAVLLYLILNHRFKSNS